MKRKRIPIPLQDGKTAWLERLSPRMIIEMSDSLWHDRRQRMIDDFNAAEVASSDRIIALSALDSERGMYSELLRHACRLDGAQEILEKAATSKAAENASDLIDRCAMQPQEMMNVACDLLGYTVEDEPEQDSTSTKKNSENESPSG